MESVPVTGCAANFSPIPQMTLLAGRDIDGTLEGTLPSVCLEPRSAFSGLLGFIGLFSHLCVAPPGIEHEYTRGGAWTYLAALDVHRAQLVGRCKPSSGIEPCHRLVPHVMPQPPDRDARRVF